MAKQTNGIASGFSGRVGNIVGYRWKGVWCVRTRPAQMRNPQTEKQMEHRGMFKEEVRLAAYMSDAVRLGLHTLADEANMTAHNLFVSVNQHAFSLVDGRFTVDYPSLRLSMGPLAPVAFGEPSVSEGNTLGVSFEKNPLRMTTAYNFDYVYLYAYCPELRLGYLTAPVHRRAKRIDVSLPDIFADKELQLYGIVQSQRGELSDSIYIGGIVMEISDEQNSDERLVMSDNLSDEQLVMSDESLGAAANSSLNAHHSSLMNQPTLFDIGDL